MGLTNEFFFRLVFYLPHLSNDVLENVFMNGLDTTIKVGFEFWSPSGLKEMMKQAQQIEDRGYIKNEQ